MANESEMNGGREERQEQADAGGAPDNGAQIAADPSAGNDEKGDGGTGGKGDAPEGEKAPEKVEDGKRVYAADQLEKVPFKTSFSQKVFIGIAILVLIAIGVTFHDAGSRENQAAQATFSVIAQPIVNSAADATGLRTSFGYPVYTLNAKTKEADIFVEFLHGPLPPEKAAQFGLRACGHLARAYVQKGYMPRHLVVHVYSRQDNAPRRYYGQAVFNGNLDDLVWENANRF